MQDEVNRECYAIAIDTVKMTARTLAQAMKAVLDGESPGKFSNAYTDIGKLSLKNLAESGMKLSNIVITDKNIKSFEHTAREFGITYALKKDKSADPPRYFVFFKARDRMLMEAAFKSYVRDVMGDKDKEPFSVALNKAAEKAAAVPVKMPQKEACHGAK